MWQADYHVHSISPDAKVPMEEVCQGALEKGLIEIAVTDHYEFYAHGVRREFFQEDYLEHYFKELEYCREKYAGQLTIRAGMEFGQLHLCTEEAIKIIMKYPFDYLIGSVHKIENVDLSKMDYTDKTVPRIAESYYQHLLRLSETGEFDCLGHLDLFKRHALRNGYPDYYEQYEPLITQILKNLIARGKGIEINTSGIRQGMGMCMPDYPVVAKYLELGGTVITLGSDAHRARDVGADFTAAEFMLKLAGVTELTLFKRRCGRQIKME